VTNRRDGFYERYLRPSLFRMDPEEAHLLSHKLLPLLSVLKTQTEFWYNDQSSRLSTTIAGHKLGNPVGLAAGFDKNGDLTEWLRFMGFGFAEIGSITAISTKGNPKPRVFRLPDDEAVINYMGLNGEGAARVAEKLSVAHSSVPLAINIAKTNHPSIVGDKAIADFVTSFNAIKDLRMIYASINVSCPNTHETKLAEVNTIDAVITGIVRINHNRIPLFVKLSPDSDRELLENVVRMAKHHGLAGFICGNTSTSRANLKSNGDLVAKIGPGGLSGPPIREKALELCREVFKLKEDSQQIIACGGITSGAEAFEFIAAGASAFEIYTGLVYHGPFLPFTICRELDKILEEQRLNLPDAVGSGIRSIAAQQA
jgi:dihydroorotate dehydrogenase